MAEPTKPLALDAFDRLTDGLEGYEAMPIKQAYRAVFVELQAWREAGRAWAAQAAPTGHFGAPVDLSKYQDACDELVRLVVRTDG